MFPASLLSTLLLALVVSANPIIQVPRGPVTLPIARSLNLTNARSLYEHDLARAQNFQTRGSDKAKRAVISTPGDNEVVIYFATVGVGSPATNYQLYIDTGSSNTWVGAGKTYVVTSTSHNTGQPVSVTYGSGSFSGTEYIDQVTIGSGLVIPSQSIGVASKSTGFSGSDGILGIGPVDLTQGTLTNEPNTLIPTVTDNLFSQGTITADEIGVSFEPTTTTSVVNGELTWGGTDSSKFTGAITYTPLTTTSPAKFYWGINESITYGTAGTTVLPTTAGIVDTGTTLLLVSTNAYNAYKTLTGATVDGRTGLLKISSTNYASLQSLFFHIGGATFEFTANGQTFPRSLNTAIGGSSSVIYLVLNSLGSPTGSGFDFINGYTWLERFYSVFDTTGGRVGFATTPFTFATTN